MTDTSTTLELFSEYVTVSDIFSDSAKLHLTMQVEVALVDAQTELGVVSKDMAEEIHSKSNVSLISAEELTDEETRVGHPMVAFLNVWGKKMSHDAAQWLHYGATTADIYDTVSILQTRIAAKAFIRDMRTIESQLMSMAMLHQNTPMVGRTLGRHALPITFGLKVSTWLAENRRNIERIKHWIKCNNTGVLSGAVGTYASFGDEGFEVERLAMKKLRLSDPFPVDWKGSRDGFAEFGSVLAIAAKTYGNIAQEIFLLQGDDIRELAENNLSIGSSTMPHKSNPFTAIAVVSLSHKISESAAVLLDWMMTIYDRNSLLLQDSIVDISLNMEKLTDKMKLLMKSLSVFPENMERNLMRTKGMILAEELMFIAAKKIGKKDAHEKIHKVASKACENNTTLKDQALKDPDLVSILEGNDIDRIFDPRAYIGLSPQVVGRTLEWINRQRCQDEEDFTEQVE